MKKVGLFGGAFDPMHSMHLAIMIAAKEQLGLDEIWVLIDKQPRRKSGVTAYGHRLRIAKISSRDFDFIKVDDLQMQKSGVTHGLVTQNELCRLYPNTQFTIILGEDSAQYFDKWESPEKFCELVDFAIVKRADHDVNLTEMLSRLGDAASKFNFEYIDVEPSSLSSSKIREDLRNKKNVDGLAPEAVEYIKQNHLYEQ